MDTMRRLFEVLVASLCLCTMVCLGFHAHAPPSLLIASFSTKSKWPNNVKFQPLIVATQMTKSEDEIAEESKNISYNSDVTDAVVTSSGINGDEASTALLTTDTDATTRTTITTTTTLDDTKASTSTGFSLILFPILLFKFSIVLLVKFATDIVVYPILYFYRMVKLVKRKIFTAAKKDGSLNLKVNGDSSASSAES